MNSIVVEYMLPPATSNNTRTCTNNNTTQQQNCSNMSLESFIRLADRLVAFNADIGDNTLPLSSIHLINIHMTELKSLWSDIKSTFDTFMADRDSEQDEDEGGADDSVNASELETFRAKFKSSYVTYCNCLATLSQLAEEFQLPATKISPSQRLVANPPVSEGHPEFQDTPSSTGRTDYSFHLPPCDTEVFHGDYMSWPTFRDMFTAVYIKNSRLSFVERLFHLTQKTRGEARDIVQRSPLTNDGFHLAWKNLCARYENRRILVNGQLKVLFNLPSISKESASALKQLQRDLTSCISALELCDIDVRGWDPLFVFLCSNRLPESTLTLWEQGLADKTAIPKWSDLDSFLTNRYRTLESVSEMRANPNARDQDSKSNSTNTKSSRNINSFQVRVSGPQCPLCPREFHVIRKCPKFIAMDINQRKSEIRKQGLCLNCFSKTHHVRNCTSKNTCFQCQRKHNTLLHESSANPEASNSRVQTPANTNSGLNANSSPFAPSPIQSTSSGTGVVQTYFSSSSRGVLLGTALVDVLHLGVTYQARVLLDSGSQGTFISERLFNRLQLPYRKVNAQISGLNDSMAASVRKECTLLLCSRYADAQISVKAFVITNLSGALPSHSIPPSIFSQLPQFELADPLFHRSSSIDILIGGDFLPSIMRSGVKHDICGSLMGQNTIFGWILTGPIPIQSPSPYSRIISNFCEISLDKEISRFWEVENLPRKNFVSAADRFCEELFVSTTKRDEDGRYVVHLPFKRDFPKSISLGNSRTSAMAQFLRNEVRLLRNLAFKDEYDSVIQEYANLSHMCQVETSSSMGSASHYYLPHHAVIKPESTTTKVRVVFNASSPSSNGVSLNDTLHTGPVLQSDLTVLILKWRFFRYVFNADIQKMYRQIRVHPNHTPFQRVLFRRDPSDDVQDFELKTVTFGVNCAPYLAIRTLFQLADDVQSSHPIASEILRSSMYVDDALVGAHSLQKAMQSKEQLISALASAGFLLRKWTANSKDILAGLPSDHLLCEDFLDFDDSSTAKMLGIRWNARSDSFYFTTKPFPDSSRDTKRELLSQISKLFDPAGWLSPCIVVAKILMQRIWSEGTGWDEVVTPGTLAKWKEFQTCYSAINEVRIPRWLHYVPSADIQFHGFCDASERAYAAALYVRIATTTSVSTHLVYSKTRVAPVKTLSIPSDPNDFAALTPGHFLIGTPILAPIDPRIEESPVSILNRWQRLKAIHQSFCVRWKNEYLRELQKRVKWQSSEKNIEENTLVVIQDDNLPPNVWRLGRVCKTYFGTDRRVRVADVVTQKGTITRPITKLVVISSPN
ncbi:uncharacterized protein LOC131996219 [Stomoxys calcitrans]|uniref:uncharacterized protein LOC131996219 n=3 Tax=Stomoxys calcitrans TaxID=35570 RepID=UPI0027E27290|nr:uncharacterized protein LOC131996219 [Stomoxys calcitrans]